MECFLNIGKKYFNMGKVIKHNVGQVSSNGNGLVIYVDSLTNEVMLKDVVGNVELLSNFIQQNSNSSSQSEFYLFEENHCIRPNNGNNSLLATNSVILSGEFNVNRGNFSIINGGESNTTANNHTPNISYLWAKPSDSTGREPSFTLFSLREGLISGCMVDKISFTSQPSNTITATLTTCTVNASTFVATASGGTYTSPATAMASGDYGWFSKASV